MSRTERYRIEPDGTVVTVYTDTVDLRAVGHIHAVRASVVEWDESDQAWTARILATGERLGPFATRAAAVAAERAVLATSLDTALEDHTGRATSRRIRSRLTRAVRLWPRAEPAVLPPGGA
jgi:hypothetical protein